MRSRSGVRGDPWPQKVLERAERTNVAFGGGDTECFRLVDRDVAGVVADRYGPCLWVSWFRPQPPAESDLAVIARLAGGAGCGHWLVNGMVDRGKDPSQAKRWSGSLAGPGASSVEPKIGPGLLPRGPHAEGRAVDVPGLGASSVEPKIGPGFPARWQAREGSLLFHLRADTGLSPGLFVDQRSNREYLRRHSRGARVLNLFAYTCSFSVAAAAGGASQTTSVDVSRPFLDWGKENFASNGLSTEGHTFTKADARDYLSLARKRGWLFNTIVLDPPSFSRSKGKTFTVRKELIPMAKHCLDLLAPGGELLVSTNLSTWRVDDLRRELREATRCLLRDGESGADITDKADAAKTFWLRKPGP